jgi:hypothetical protein
MMSNVYLYNIFKQPKKNVDENSFNLLVVFINNEESKFPITG